MKRPIPSRERSSHGKRLQGVRRRGPVEKVWSAIADVGAPNKLITFLGETTLEGDRRSCSLGDMGKLEELIVSVDDENRRVVYSIRESPFNFTHHSASMQAIPNGGRDKVPLGDRPQARPRGSGRHLRRRCREHQRGA